MNDDETLGELGRALGHDPERTPPADRVAAIRASAEGLRPQHRAPGGEPDNVTPLGSQRQRSGRRMFLAGGIAAGVGGIAGYVGRDLVAEDPAVAPTAAKVEEITFTGPDQVTTKAGLINHTWGTELMLEVSGLDAGSTYDVVYGTGTGSAIKAGSMLAVPEVVMTCRFTASALRADVRAIEIHQGDRMVLRSRLPVVQA